MPNVKVLGQVSVSPQGDWVSSYNYTKLDLVRHQNASYLARQNNIGVEPNVSTNWQQYWMLLVQDGSGGGNGAVVSVNGKTGIVLLDAIDVGAVPKMPNGETPLINGSGQIDETYLPPQPSGTVKSVNDVTPNEDGNVELTAVDVGAVPSSPNNVTPLINEETGEVDPIYLPDSPLNDSNYELIEKVVIGYSITTAQPEDWATNYTAYFTNTGTQKEPTYTAVSGDSAPTWQAGTYYSFDGTTKVKFTRNKTPNGEPYQFKKATYVSIAQQGEQVAGYVSMVTDYKTYDGWEYGSMVNVQRFSQTNNPTQTVAEARVENGKIFLYSFYGSSLELLSIIGSNFSIGSTSFSARRWITKETKAKYITKVETGSALIPNTEVYIFAVK